MTLHLISNSPVSNQTLICRILLLSFVIWQALRAPLAISPLRSWGRTPTESLWISGPVVRPKYQNNSQMSQFFWQMAGFLHGWFGENIISLNLTPTFSHWANCSGLIGPWRKSKTLGDSAAILLSHTCLIKGHIDCPIHEILEGVVCCVNSAFGLPSLTKQSEAGSGQEPKTLEPYLALLVMHGTGQQGWI